jgi:hypothetical protein
LAVAIEIPFFRDSANPGPVERVLGILAIPADCDPEEFLMFPGSGVENLVKRVVHSLL